MTGEDLTVAQEQRISCHLHLEPTEDVTEDQEANCSCYTEQECRGNNWLYRYVYFLSTKSL